MEEVLNYLKENPTFYIATVEGDQPRVRPFGAVAEFEGKLYICTNNTKKVFKQIEKNSKVEISAVGKDGSWLRLEAKCIADERKEAKEKMLADNPGLKNMYSVDDGIFEVLYLKDATATFASMKGEPKVVKF
ncbi:pyridoxamine 5'-phosphate oxidase family protein [Clostridium hydrogenum]|uniref:pyridoxamine 5'-phosphate oxidase family protein n=1 Tax=Clostridium hydrogenum TaxID=2855764 RepID=UPI001F379C8D|nr:pyridoxamine 5'-phosphate oxidase family protein [Clostridium hydrogenum]